MPKSPGFYRKNFPGFELLDVGRSVVVATRNGPYCKEEINVFGSKELLEEIKSDPDLKIAGNRLEFCWTPRAY